MKKFLALLLALMMVASLFAGCGASEPAAKDDAAAGANAADAIADEMTSADGKYQVAFVTDVGQLKDQSFNQGTYDGVKLYASANGKSYKYYQPANGDQATDDDRIDAMKLACENGAEVVVAAGFMQEAALKAAAEAYPNVNFVFIDGYPIGFDNVAGIAFREEQCGYLAGYAAVMDGYTKLGFSGGGGGTNPACCRYGYGFVQGAEAAAAKKGVKVEINYSWLYGSSFQASSELQTMAAGWYANGTEAIFACGGSMFASISAAAAAEDCKVIGVDVDQSFQSPTVITSAMKGLADATAWAIGKHYDGAWAEIGGTATSLGAANNAVGLPTATWSLTGWTVEEYEALFADIVAGNVEIKADLVEFPESTENVTVTPV
ncbi:MAG: BMP family ABC transporter substrate-binding protein, partial [Oscillospiraceae bacterium]|nr:BMP family ABC transporter substrate-binding protein [Oscillospiraceae bacterium]